MPNRLTTQPSALDCTINAAMEMVMSLSALAEDLASSKPATSRHVAGLAQRLARDTLLAVQSWPT